MRPYSVEIFRPDFTMVGNTNVNEVTYKEDYLTSDENTITVLALPGIEKQDFIRISRGSEEYAGVVTEIGYGTDRSKRLQTISYKPLVELLNTGILFDVNAQGQGTLEEFICDRIWETFIENPDTLQNIHGLSVAHTSATSDWSLHITPAQSGGHYNIVNLMDSVIVPAMQKYGILVKAALDIQNREIHLTVGRASGSVLTIEADLPNIIKICSMMSELGRETVSAYAAAKGGLKMLTRNICSEFGGANIQCNGIGPGYIATPQTAPLRERQPDGSRHPFDQFIISKTPAGRWGTTEDLMGPAVFLASPASDFVNGHILYVDGGILAYIGKQP